MRQKRAKAYRKLMQLYSMSFGFRQPYQVLVGSEMCKEAVTHKIDLFKQFRTVLQGEVKLMITQCCIHELYLQGRSQQPAVDVAKTFERRKCNHREAIPGDDCLQSVIGESNKHRYVVASQSQPLRSTLRTVPATPLVHITRSVMVLEPPSDATLQAKETNEEEKLHANETDLALLGHSAPVEQPKPKRKGPKGPNPLSMKKKMQPALASQQHTSALEVNVMGMKRKAEDDADGADVDDGVTSNRSHKKKRKRRKKNITHVQST